GRLEQNSSGFEQTPSANPSGPESGSNRVFRGGSWRHDADRCRSAYRVGYEPSDRDYNLGFRLSRTV
ncbi:MAG: SUMF1/EgtB/PvdO family nonheme iron enzyme, partial [Chromatiaceae bacterium]